MDRFDKEIKKRNKPKKPKRRYYFHGYELAGWWVYPIAIPFIIIEDYIDGARREKYLKLKFTPEKAKAMIDKYFFDVSDFDEETEEFIFCKDWRDSWGCRAKKKDKPWCNKFDKELYTFLKEEYFIPNVSKRIEKDWDNEFVIFKKE